MRNWIPNQHGAWAFVLTPVIIGAICGRPMWEHLILLISWLAAYCFNFYIGMTVKSWRRPDRWRRYRAQQLLYGSIAAVGAGYLLVWKPQLALIGLALLPIFVANLWFIAARNERAWANDLLGVAAATAMGAVAVNLGGHWPSNGGVMLTAVFLYFGGTVPYVKTMIRERGKQNWLWISRGWHLLSVCFALVTVPFYIFVFGPALLRAWLLPGRKITPKQVGFIEIGLTLILAWVAITTTTLAFAV